MMIIKWNSLSNGGKKRKQILIVFCFTSGGKSKGNSQFEAKFQIMCWIFKSYVIFFLALCLCWEYFQYL